MRRISFATKGGIVTAITTTDDDQPDPELRCLLADQAQSGKLVYSREVSAAVRLRKVKASKQRQTRRGPEQQERDRAGVRSAEGSNLEVVNTCDNLFNPIA